MSWNAAWRSDPSRLGMNLGESYNVPIALHAGHLGFGFAGCGWQSLAGCSSIIIRNTGVRRARITETRTARLARGSRLARGIWPRARSRLLPYATSKLVLVHSAPDQTVGTTRMRVVESSIRQRSTFKASSTKGSGVNTTPFVSRDRIDLPRRVAWRVDVDGGTLICMRPREQ